MFTIIEAAILFLGIIYAWSLYGRTILWEGYVEVLPVAAIILKVIQPYFAPCKTILTLLNSILWVAIAINIIVFVILEYYYTKNIIKSYTERETKNAIDR